MSSAASASELKAATLAIERWIAALNTSLDGALTPLAFTEDAVIERCGVKANRDKVLDTHSGHIEIAAWVARVPEGTVFTRTSDVAAETGDAGETLWTARYRITVEDFEGGGLWRVRLAEDGRLSWINHQPDDLKDS